MEGLLSGAGGTAVGLAIGTMIFPGVGSLLGSIVGGIAGSLIGDRVMLQTYWSLETRIHQMKARRLTEEART